MIPVCEPFIGDEELSNVRQCVESGWISGGSFIELFEKKWAMYCGRKHGIAVCNGTVALQLALQALELPKGSEVIMPSFTIMSCALAAIHNGLIPVFVDVDPETWCIDPLYIEKQLTSLTRAIMPVHIYGHPAQMDELLLIAKKHNLVVVEDAAQAHGAQYRGIDGVWRKCGSFGELSCFSFYSNKLVTTGEGGMILTDSDEMNDKLRSMRNLCFGKGSARFIHTGIGHNFRMTNIQAAIGVAQIDKIHEALRLKWSLSQTYDRLLRSPKIKRQSYKDYACPMCWMYGILVDDPVGLAAHLANKGIETRPFFFGLHQQSTITTNHVGSQSLPVTEHLSSHGLYLPSGVQLTGAMIEEVAKSVMEFI